MLRRTWNANSVILIVIPAQAGIHVSGTRTADRWIPACAGMTVRGYDNSFCRRSAMASAVLSGVKVAAKRPAGSMT